MGFEKVAEAIENNREEILKANQIDIKVGKENNMPAALIDRLMLDDQRLDGIIEGVNTVINYQIQYGDLKSMDHRKWPYYISNDNSRSNRYSI